MVLVGSTVGANNLLYKTKQAAHSVLSRSKRANKIFEEATRPSNYYRECVEEDCDWNEFHEFWENKWSTFSSKYEAVNLRTILVKLERKTQMRHVITRLLEGIFPNPP